MQHRLAGVAYIRSTWQYRTVEDHPIFWAILPPDPWNLTLSKRAWEIQVARWRDDLQRWAEALTILSMQTETLAAARRGLCCVGV